MLSVSWSTVCGSKFTLVMVVNSPSISSSACSGAGARPSPMSWLAGQAVLRRCRVRAFAADTGLTGTGSAVRRLLALKTKHLFVHFRTLSSLDVVSMDGLAGLYTGRTRGVFSASIRGGAPLAGRAWNAR